MSNIETIKTKWMYVTPAMAKEWLQKNGSNRPFKEVAIETYSKDQKKGNWDITHQGIAFGIQGNLIDGQNRLAAIVRSGVTVYMSVTTGLPYTSAMNVSIDVGRMRTNADIFGENNKKMQVINYLCKLIHGSPAVKSQHTVSPFLNTFGDLVDEVSKACGSTGRLTSSAPVRAVVAIRSLEDKEVLNQNRALVLIETEKMWPSIAGLFRQISNGVVSKNGGSNVLASKSWVAFNPKRSHIKIITQKDYIIALNDFRNTIIGLMG